MIAFVEELAVGVAIALGVRAVTAVASSCLPSRRPQNPIDHERVAAAPLLDPLMFLYIGTTQPEHFPNNHSHGTPGAKFAVAVGLGAVVGFERQWRNRLARLRTSTPVAPGAASVSFSRNSLRMTKPEPRAAQVAASDSQRRPDLPKEPKRTVAHYGRAAMAFGRDWRIADAGNLLYAADPGPLFWFTPGRNSR